MEATGAFWRFVNEGGAAMDLDYLEQEINPIILARGKHLYQEKAIKILRIEHGACTAYVQGTDLYKIEITLTNAGKVFKSHCSCPFTGGEYCKHQVAVFLALDEIQNSPDFDDWKSSQIEKIEPTRQANKAAPAKTQARSGGDLSFTPDARKMFVKSVREMVREDINQAKHRGFVDYRDMPYALRGADNALSMANGKIKENDLESGARICIMLIDEMLRLLPHCDDSDGGAGEILNWASEYILDALEKMPSEHPAREDLFQTILKMLKKEYTQDWLLDYIPLLVPLAGAEKKRKITEELLAPFLLRGSEYDKQHAQNIMLDLVKRYDGAQAYGKYLRANLRNPDFREIAIQSALDADKLDEALRLCLGGEKMDGNYQGLVGKWQHYRLEVYRRKNDVDALIQLHEKFVLDGEIASYHALRDLLDGEAWHNERAMLLAKLKNSGQRFGLYKNILILEDCQPELFELLQGKGGYGWVKELAPYLGPGYTARLAPLFRQWLLAAFPIYNSNRKAYQQYCEKIRHFQTACSKEAASGFIAELEEQYKRRPALLEELGKIK